MSLHRDRTSAKRAAPASARGTAGEPGRRFAALRTAGLLFAPALGAFLLALVFGSLLGPESSGHPARAATPAPHATAPAEPR